MHPAEWIEAYGRAWEGRDADAAGELFTEDAIYRLHALQPPLVGAVSGLGPSHAGRRAIQTESSPPAYGLLSNQP